MECVDIVVGHNLEVDLNMIQVELARRSVKYDAPTVQYCTMLESKERGLMNPGYLKYPSLLFTFKINVQRNDTKTKMFCN